MLAAPVWGRNMFVVCGEALMDVFGGECTAQGMALDARIGGSPLNVAIGLARLAQPVAFFGALSTGFLGQRLLRALRDEGVHTGAVTAVDAPTTLALVGLDDRGAASFAFYGQGGADRLLPREALAGVPAAARAFHVGSYAMVVEPVAATLRALVEREHARSLIAWDPNVRLAAEPDLHRWRSTLQWMLPRTHLLKLSAEDLELLFPGVPADALAQDWLAQGVACVVLTQGSAGAVAWRAGERWVLPAVPVSVVDSVGAGDSFQAALLAGLADCGVWDGAALRNLPAVSLQQVLRFAARAAAFTCSRRGADLPRRGELA